MFIHVGFFWGSAYVSSRQVGYPGLGFMFQRRRDSELQLHNGQKTELLHRDGATEGHCAMLPCALGGTGSGYSRRARHDIQVFPLVWRRSVSNSALAYIHFGPAGSQTLRYQRHLLEPQRIWWHFGELLALVQRHSH